MRLAALVVRRPLPGLTVARFTGERPLLRSVPEKHGTTMHLAGRSEWTSGRTRFSTFPGSVSVKVPGAVSVERTREGTLDFQVVLFDDTLVDSARTALDRPLSAQTHEVDLRDPRGHALVSLHRRLLDDDELPAVEEALCEALHALADLASRRRATFSAAVTRARAMLDARIRESIGLEELATHARLDKFRLCRAFREEIGLPPHAYVTHRRVALAQELLARGMSQAEVAARVGFYDQSLLHRHFKRVVGLTPGAFVRAAG